MKKDAAIILIGMPASGKSTLGRLLAQRLGYRFVDTDTLIEATTQRIGRINALFTQVQQLWTAVDSFDTPAMQPNPADGEPATLKIYPPLSH